MRKFAVPSFALLALLCSPHFTRAGMIKAYFSHFAVTGAKDREETQKGVENLLISRLAGDAIFAVETPAEADITLTGDYVEFGKVFGIDAVATSREGIFLARAFVQGEGKDELIPAVAQLARDLAGEVRKAAPPPSSLK
jgi:hypothetical protein